MNDVGFNKEEDIVLMVFGEVDVRAHIVEQSLKQGKHVFHITRDVVNRYWKAIKTVQDDGYTVAVFGCIAGFKLKEGAPEPPWPQTIGRLATHYRFLLGRRWRLFLARSCWHPLGVKIGSRPRPRNVGISLRAVPNSPFHLPKSCNPSLINSRQPAPECQAVLTNSLVMNLGIR